MKSLERVGLLLLKLLLLSLFLNKPFVIFYSYMVNRAVFDNERT